MSAYRDPVPREASGVPREPTNWARVGGVLIIGSVAALIADGLSASALCMATSHDAPIETRWIAVVCFMACAVGGTLAVCADGKSFPNLP